MKLSIQEISKWLRSNNQNGVIVINNVPHEVTLTIDGDVTLTGRTWKWEETSAPSAHEDYVVEADQFVKTSLLELPTIKEEDNYEFYVTVDDYLNIP